MGVIGIRNKVQPSPIWVSSLRTRKRSAQMSPHGPGTISRLLYRRRPPIALFLATGIPVSSDGSYRSSLFFLYPYFLTTRWLSINSEWLDPRGFGGMNAYDVLGVSQTSSFEDIKASFRKLAKETHPDTAKSRIHSYDAKKFLLIVAAYEVLSDSTRRAHYDRYILAQGNIGQKLPGQYDTSFSHNSCRNSSDEEVVEWMKWYRYTIRDILSERRVIAGSGYFDVLERNFYSALHAAYFGPNIDPIDFLPNCFEAEERSTHSTSEVLHLVSGRYVFGMVCLGRHELKEKLESSSRSSKNLGETLSTQLQFDAAESKGPDKRLSYEECKSSDAYSDLELLICGRVVAKARRVLSKEHEDSEDQISVFLNVQDGQANAYSGDESSPGGSGDPLGIIKGLGTSSEEAACYVYNSNGMKTHMIMKHRTFLVKHLHWFRIGDNVSVCECRCSRARLPPSKYWLFEPRSAMHDTGGWYVETFGRDYERNTVPSQRRWSDFDNTEKRLHPAIYLLTLAYRTLDIEHAIRTKMSIKKRVEEKMSRAFSWYKKVS